jgi:hypothetical protein
LLEGNNHFIVLSAIEVAEFGNCFFEGFKLLPAVSELESFEFGVLLAEDVCEDGVHVEDCLVESDGLVHYKRRKKYVG